jgi:formylmethanofuran dehydrogenase subunit E
MSTLRKLLEKSAAMHRHLCPRQVLGVRMGMLAGKLLGLDLPQEEKRLLVFMETDGCAADGVSVSTGCWVGRRTMRIVDFGKVAATFIDTNNDRAYRINPHPTSRLRAREYSPQAKSRWHAQRDVYQNLSDEKLLVATPVELQVDLKSIISRPGVRVNCDICGEEIINEREIIHEGTVLCLGCAGENYYEAISKGVPSRVR